jgi:hypothetical protein
LVFLPRGVSTTFLIQTPHVDTEVALGSPDYSLSVSQNSEEPGRGWILPGRLCARFLNKGGQSVEQEDQHSQEQGPPDTLAQGTESPGTGPHAGGLSPKRSFCMSLGLMWWAELLSAKVRARERTHLISTVSHSGTAQCTQPLPVKGGKEERRSHSALCERF